MVHHYPLGLSHLCGPIYWLLSVHIVTEGSPQVCNTRGQQDRREVSFTHDLLLLEPRQVAPFYPQAPYHTLGCLSPLRYFETCYSVPMDPSNRCPLLSLIVMVISCFPRLLDKGEIFLLFSLLVAICGRQGGGQLKSITF